MNGEEFSNTIGFNSFPLVVQIPCAVSIDTVATVALSVPVLCASVLRAAHLRCRVVLGSIKPSCLCSVDLEDAALGSASKPWNWLTLIGNPKTLLASLQRRLVLWGSLCSTALLFLSIGNICSLANH